MINDELMSAIKEAQKQYNSAEKKLLSLMAQCKHSWIKSGDSVKCNICGRYGGWFCPDSPDSTCEYYHETDEEGNGYYDEDECIHCGKPKERK